MLTGRAWSGTAPISRVEVSTDGGRRVERRGARCVPAGRWAWRSWSFDWTASIAGSTELCCRATDELGNVQPVDQPWNRQGMANNMIHRVPVVVR